MSKEWWMPLARRWGAKLLPTEGPKFRELVDWVVGSNEREGTQVSATQKGTEVNIIDYKRLLERYMYMVLSCEGITYHDRGASDFSDCFTLSREEEAELSRINNMVWRLYHPFDLDAVKRELGASGHPDEPK